MNRRHTLIWSSGVHCDNAEHTSLSQFSSVDKKCHEIVRVHHYRAIKGTFFCCFRIDIIIFFCLLRGIVFGRDCVNYVTTSSLRSTD